MNDSKLFTMPDTSKSKSKSKQHNTKSTANNSSMTLAKEWLMRFSEKHTEGNSEYERWMNK